MSRSTLISPSRRARCSLLGPTFLVLVIAAAFAVVSPGIAANGGASGSLASTCGDWTLLIPGGTSSSLPLGRELHTMVYDPARQRMVLFGGDATLPLNDVWVATMS